MHARRPIHSSNLALDLATPIHTTMEQPKPLLVRSPAASVRHAVLLGGKGARRTETRSQTEIHLAISAPAVAASAALMKSSRASRSNSVQSARQCYLASTSATSTTVTPHFTSMLLSNILYHDGFFFFFFFFAATVRLTLVSFRYHDQGLASRT